MHVNNPFERLSSGEVVNTGPNVAIKPPFIYPPPDGVAALVTIRGWIYTQDGEAPMWLEFTKPLMISANRKMTVEVVGGRLVVDFVPRDVVE